MKARQSCSVVRIFSMLLSGLAHFGARLHTRGVNANCTGLDSDPQTWSPSANHANSLNVSALPLCNGVSIEEASIDDLQRYMSTGQLSSQKLATCYLQRIWQTGPYLNYVLEVNPDFMEIAAQLDRERRDGHLRGPLHGIPFMVKDNIATADRMQTTAGSWALLGSEVPRDAHVVHKLRAAGALLLGKTTLSEWADMRSNNYSEGYSARGGQCRSAYNLTVNPGGSSSGSAVGVAANVFTFALGTETDGSIINPAARNAIVGIKPTVGLTSRAGVIPESEHQDTVGCFGKTVRDAAYVLDAIYGEDIRDNYTLAQIGRTPREGYVPFLSDHAALKHAAFGIPWESFWIHATTEQQGVLQTLVDSIRAAGATIINGTELPERARLVSPSGWDWDFGTKRGFPNESEYTYIKVDFYNNIKSYLSDLRSTQMRTLDDIVAYNYANDGSEGGHPWPLGNPAFYSGQDIFLASLETKGVQDDVYWQALSFCQNTSRRGGIDAALTASAHGFTMDALLVPSDVSQAYQVAAQAGYPMITIPAGIDSRTGMGFGLGLMSTAWREDSLVRWASAIESLQRSMGFRRPRPQWHNHLARNIPVTNL